VADNPWGPSSSSRGGRRLQQRPHLCLADALPLLLLLPPPPLQLLLPLPLERLRLLPHLLGGGLLQRLLCRCRRLALQLGQLLLLQLPDVLRLLQQLLLLQRDHPLVARALLRLCAPPGLRLGGSPLLRLQRRLRRQLLLHQPLLLLLLLMLMLMLMLMLQRQRVRRRRCLPGRWGSSSSSGGMRRLLPAGAGLLLLGPRLLLLLQLLLLLLLPRRRRRRRLQLQAARPRRMRLRPPADRVADRRHQRGGQRRGAGARRGRGGQRRRRLGPQRCQRRRCQGRGAAQDLGGAARLERQDAREAVALQRPRQPRPELPRVQQHVADLAGGEAGRAGGDGWSGLEAGGKGVGWG
jgi:hypothetical protein